jgi:tetratricopeptide (TPR) repeat protein
LAATAGLAAPVTVPELGTIDFPNSGAPEAQAAFARGALFLHSFEYEDAREAFREARRQDPDFALAAWGEAMTHNHPLWREQDRDAALAALAELGSTPEERLSKAPTEREKGYLRAVETLYGEGDKVSRDRAYERAMEELAAAYPEDLEARAFWALSILGTAQGVRDFGTYMRAGAVAEEVFAANPQHPGAAHYLIHSYDDPVHAPLGLRAARVYARIAPAATHAQHMISHIYVALGRWHESVAANVKSYQVSVERAEKKNLGVDARNYHALHWLQYSYLQLGRFAEAREELELMRPMAAESRSPRALWYYAAMRAGLIVESGVAFPTPPSLGGEGVLGAEVLDTFGTGYAAAKRGEAGAAAAAAARLREALEASGSGPDETTTGFLGVTAEDRNRAEVMALELEALVEKAKGETAGAVELLEKAAALEASLSLQYGPPEIVKPSHELLGEVLLELGRPEEALERFAEALARAPRRSQSLAGRALAAKGLGRAELATRACEELRSIRAEADADVALPEACPASV